MRILPCLFLFILFINANAQTKYQKDFAFYWQSINDDFAYFDTQKTNWDKVRTIYQPVADTIATDSDFIHLLETVNNELYNGHISLNINLPSSNRIIPTGADLWVAYKQKQFVITAIRAGFSAARSGLKRGMIVTHFNGMPMDSAILPFLPRSVPFFVSAMYDYAANMILAGRHNTKRNITAQWQGSERIYFPDSAGMDADPYGSKLIDYRKMPNNIGYIKINNSLGDNALIGAFDGALDSLWDTQGIVLDLTETPSGGNSTVARAIMSRFIGKEMPYQRHRIPAEEKQFGVKRSWVEWVSPRGRIYTKPLIVLVNQWTGSMGEGIAIGFDGMKRAKVAGDKMAGLLGAVYSYKLPETGIGFSIPVEKLFHVNGTPREMFMPKALPNENEDPILQATKMLEEMIRKH